MNAEEAKKASAAWLADRHNLLRRLVVPHKVTLESVPYEIAPSLVYLEKQLTGRDYVLKSRQLYITTYFCFQDMLSAVSYPNYSSLLLCDKDDDAKIYYDLYHMIYDQLPEQLEVVPGYPIMVKPPLLTDNLGLLELNTPGGHAYLRIMGARGLTLARGFRINNLHAPELGLWNQEFARAALGAALGAVSPKATIKIETTAKGAGSYAHDLWLRSKEGLSGIKPIFLPWMLDNTARTKATDSSALLGDRVSPLKNLTEEELRIMRDWNLTEEAIRYRRVKKALLDDLAPQEQAEDDITCWVQSGRTVLPLSVIDEYLSRTNVPLTTDPDYEVYQLPSPLAKYVIGVDVMEGMGDRNSDSHCIFVMNSKTLECAAIYSGKCPIPALVAKVEEIATHYNKAFVVVERNSYGAAVLQYLSPRYDNLYSDGDKLGWHTNIATKPLMVEALRRVILDRSFKCFSRNYWEESRNFLRLDNGRVGTQGSAHDDRVMASALACVGAERYEEASTEVHVTWT